MGMVYKVTHALVGKTKSGYELYKIQLNNSVLATKLLPLRKREKRYDKLYNKYLENNRSLDFLVGKYISISLNKTRYGIEFSSIDSFDVLSDFKELLDNANGKAFSTSINIYGFLKERGYDTNTEGSLILKPPYHKFCISEHNICYPNDLQENTLTPANIGIIFEKFYKGRVIDNGNPDRSESYVLTSTSIAKNRIIYHKTKSETLSNENFDVLCIGEKLTEEQYKYILSVQ